MRQMNLGSKGMMIGGGLTGLISDAVGNARPLGAMFFLGMNISGSAYVASEAFAALAIHLCKSIVY